MKKIGYRKEIFEKTPIVTGRERSLIIGVDEVRKSVFAICELDSLIASHNEQNFSNSKDYPIDEKGRNVNDRNYLKDKNAQAKVKSVAQDLKPNLIIDTGSSPSGTPIITVDGIVVSGNNRIMSLKLAKSNFLDNYNNYKKVLNKELDYGGYGIKSESISTKIKNPVLVRIDYDFKGYNSTELNKYNISREKSEKQIDKSIRISQLLKKNDNCKNQLIDLINQQEVVSELYNNVNSVAKFKKILLDCGLITDNDISSLFTSNSLSEQGKIMYNTILLSLVLNEDSLEVSQNSGIKGYTKNVVNAILPLIKNKSLEKGSLIKYVNDSFLIQNDLINNGYKYINDYIKQQSFEFDGEKKEYKNKKALIVNSIVNTGFSKLKNVLLIYNNSMQDNILPNMFGDQLSEKEIFEKTFEIEVDKKTTDLINKMNNKKPVNEMKSKKTEPKYYIPFMNKDRRYQTDYKFFNTNEEATKWAKNEFEKFDPDVIYLIEQLPDDKKYLLKNIPESDVKYSLTDKVKFEGKFSFSMLSRYQQDAEYFINSNGGERNLYFPNVEEHIMEMKKLYNVIPKNQKPEWLTMDMILDYEKQMLAMKNKTAPKKDFSMDVNSLEKVDWKASGNSYQRSHLDKKSYSDFVKDNIDKSFYDLRGERYYTLKSLDFDANRINVDEISKKGKKTLMERISLTGFGDLLDTDQIMKADENYLKNLTQTFSENFENKIKISFDVLNTTKKGDKYKFLSGDAIKKNYEEELIVNSNNIVLKGKPNESRKVTFANVKNLKGVKHYAYKKINNNDDGKWRFAKGDMSKKVYSLVKLETGDKLKDTELMKINKTIDRLLKFAETFDPKDKELKKVESAIIKLKNFRSTFDF